MTARRLPARIGAILVAGAAALSIYAQQFVLPTPNREIYDADGGGARYYVGTVARPWPSGTFGCVRTAGAQMHEGVDIRAVKRDSKGEPLDPIYATAAGVVAYVNDKSALSNYGKYIILRHPLDGLEIYSMYAHLSQVKVRVGSKVKAGETIGVMGRTSNTRQGISKERAHVHFELTLMVNDRFSSWHGKSLPGQRNDHGLWNGRNFLGIDPTRVLLAQKAEGAKFSILNHLRAQTALCRVLVPDTTFSWLRRYTPLVRRNPKAEREGVVAYEIALDYNGVPFELVPRARSEVGAVRVSRVLSVNEKELKAHPCRRLVAKRAGKWELTAGGRQLIELLTY